MDLDRVREHLDTERRTLARDGELLDTFPLFTRLRTVDGSRHAVTFSALSSDIADEIIADQAVYFQAQSGEVEWKAYGHDGPADLLARLERHGFEIGACEAVLVLDLQSRPAWIDTPSSHRVVRIEQVADLPRFQQLAEEIFHWKSQATLDELTASLRAGATNHLAYIAYDGDTPASIGRLYTHPNSVFGGLYGGGTLAAHRSRGIYRSLVAARALDAAKFGARYLVVDALPTSRPILERLGFVHLTDTWPCTLKRTGA